MGSVSSSGQNSTMKNRLIRGLGLVVMVASVGSLFFYSSYGQQLEEEFGLKLLFNLRGNRPPPSEVWIINLDDPSSEALGLPKKYNVWPRSVHARLVERLQELGVAAIAFDVHFAEHRDSLQDNTFASAIREAGNVVLFQGLSRTEVSLENGADSAEMETLVPPIPVLADAAAAVAPHPLPKLPVRINQYWTFKVSAGHAPTMPVAVMETLAVRSYEQLYQLISLKFNALDNSLPPVQQMGLAEYDTEVLASEIRSFLVQQPELIRELLEELERGGGGLQAAERRVFQALLKVYLGETSIYLNYYGPPRTFPTLTYFDLLAPDSETRLENQLRDAVVFIGAVKNSWSGQKDGFYTVFSRPDGTDLSGVELAATAFANLLEGVPLQILSPANTLLLLLGCSLGTSLICVFLSPLFAVMGLAIFSGCYLAFAKHLFTVHGSWLPVMTPVMLQSGLVFVGALVWKYVAAGRQHENIRKALGYYLPDKVVSELSRDLSYIETGDQMVYSACLMTDAQHYTTLCEELDPKLLSVLMKDYYSHLFGPVRSMGGVISDVVGDSMLALWPAIQSYKVERGDACLAAIQVVEAVDRFNKKHPATPLPTRIGLHYGYLLMGNIGAESHFEYTPVGDIVNTVSRIEALNKYLGTKILASQETVAGVSGLNLRELGDFLLAGKSKPITIYELNGLEGSTDFDALCEQFMVGVSHYRARRWDQAIASFYRCFTLYHNDGPSRFYLQLCDTMKNNPPEPGWQGVIQIDTK